MKTIAASSLLLLLSLRALGATTPDPLKDLNISLDYNLEFQNVQGPNERTGGTVVAQFRTQISLYADQYAWCELEQEMKAPLHSTKLPILKAKVFRGPRKANMFLHGGNYYADLRLDRTTILRCYTPVPVHTPFGFMKIMERSIPGLRFLVPTNEPGDKWNH